MNDIRSGKTRPSNPKMELMYGKRISVTSPEKVRTTSTARRSASAGAVRDPARRDRVHHAAMTPRARRPIAGPRG
jgi:hypothetical protein